MLRLPVAAALAVLAIVAAIEPAEARRIRHHQAVCDNSDVMRPCQPAFTADRLAARPARASNRSGRYLASARGRAAARASYAARHQAPAARPRPAIDQARVAAVVNQVVDHPAGCPRRLHCGCGAAVRVFGAPIRALWLAAEWFRFPRAQPAPGMVAVRRHHVFVLERELAPGIWLVYDANSGRGLTRIHSRSIAGWTIVNPRAGRA